MLALHVALLFASKIFMVFLAFLMVLSFLSTKIQLLELENPEEEHESEKIITTTLGFIALSSQGNLRQIDATSDILIFGQIHCLVEIWAH